jgi:hypothetical protein
MHLWNLWRQRGGSVATYLIGRSQRRIGVEEALHLDA